MRSVTCSTCGSVYEMNTTPRPFSLALQHLTGLARTEVVGRLVEDDHLLGPRHGPADCNRLPLATGELRDGSACRGDRDPDTVEFGCGALIHRLLIKEAQLAEQPRLEQLPTEEHVGPNRQIRRKASVLVQRLDAGLEGLTGRTPPALGPVQDHRAAVGGMDTGKALDERRLAGPVVTHKTDDFAGMELSC